MSLRLEVLEGPMLGSVFEFRQPDSYTVGRAADCQLSLSKDPYVSRHHFVLDAQPPACSIKDLGSRNGVVVNDVRYFAEPPEGVPEVERAPGELSLKHGDCIQVGHTVIRVVVMADAPCRRCGVEFSPHDQETGVWTGEEFTCSKCAVEHEAQGGSSREESIDLDIGPEKTVPTGGRDQLPNIPGFRVQGCVGKGFYTQIYLARDLSNGRKVALRMQPAGDSEVVDSRLRELFRDTEFSTRLKHRNVAQWQKTDASGRLGIYYLPYWPLGTLKDLVSQQGGKLGEEDAAAFVLQALDGLAYLHDERILHRSLRPSNLLVSRHEMGFVIRITGFGLAKDLGGSEDVKPPEDRVKTSTFPFLPREQVQSFADVGPAADVFAMGATLYYLITRSAPYSLEGAPDPLQVILEGQTVPVRKRDPGVSVELAAVIDRAVHANPDERFASAAEFRSALLTL